MSSSYILSVSSLDLYKQLFVTNPYSDHLNIVNETFIKNKVFEEDGESIQTGIVYLLEEIKKKIKSEDLSTLSEIDFENRISYFSFFISYCYYFLDSFLNFEKENLKLLLLIEKKSSLVFERIFNLILDITLLSFESLILSKDFIISKEAKKELIEIANARNYPYFFNFFIAFDTMTTDLKNEFLNSFFNNLDKKNENPPLTKIVKEVNDIEQVNESTVTPVIQNKIVKTNNEAIDPKKDNDNIGQFMTNFKFEKLSKPRQQVLTNAYHSLKLNLIEPAGVCKVEDCLYFIALNKDHPGINLFINFLEKQIQHLIKKYFNISTVEKQLNDQSTLENKTIFVNWFSFNEDSPYKKLIQLDVDVLHYNKTIFKMNKTEVKNTFQIWKSADSSSVDKETALNKLKKFYCIGYHIEPGEFFAFPSKYSSHKDLFDLWNLQITNLTREDYEYNRREIQKLSNDFEKTFICSNSYPWSGMVCSYWFQNVLDKNKKNVGFESNGKLNWNGTLTSMSRFKRDKKQEITDLRKIKPGDVFIQKSRHFLIVFDIIFFTKIEDNKEVKYIQFYFIHGNCSGWHPFLQKYLEGVVIIGPPPDFSIYLEFDLWNKKNRPGGDVKVFREEEVLDNFWIFNLLGD